MFGRLRERTNGFTVTPRQYVWIAYFALGALSLIVFSGSAVRLTDSGLGCPDWPRCFGKPYPPLDTHSLIEFGNRVFSFFVTLAVFAAALGAMRRRPYRRDLALWAWILPAGALVQAALGAFTVESELQYGWVMAHFGVSMALMIAAVGLVWRARHEPGWREPSQDRVAVWSVRAIVPVAAAALLTGMVATASGPHAGGEPGQVDRFEPKGGYTLEWVVERHGRFAELLGVLAVIAWVLLRRRGAPPPLRRSVTALCLLVAAQGLVGVVQWQLELPPELVWVHIVLATATWIAVLWSAAEAGRLKPAHAAAKTVTMPE